MKTLWKWCMNNILILVQASEYIIEYVVHIMILVFLQGCLWNLIISYTHSRFWYWPESYLVRVINMNNLHWTPKWEKTTLYSNQKLWMALVLVAMNESMFDWQYCCPQMKSKMLVAHTEPVLVEDSYDWRVRAVRCVLCVLLDYIF